MNFNLPLNFNTNFLTSKFSLIKIKPESTLVNRITLEHWIINEINKSTLYNFEINWSSTFWINYYFKNISPFFNNNKLEISNKLKDGYVWINILKNTYFTLIAYAISHPNNFKVYNFLLIEKIANQIRNDLKNTFLNGDYLLPTNLLELEILKKLKYNQKRISNVEFLSLESLSFYDEASSILEFINNTSKRNRNYRFQLIVPSINYFELVFEPLFLKNNLNYFISKKKYFLNTLIGKLLFSLKKLYDDGFIFQDFLSTISLLGNYEYTIEGKKFKYNDLHPIFIKYHIGEERFIYCLELENIFLEKINYFRNIILGYEKRIKNESNLFKLFQLLLSLLQSLIGEKNVKKISNLGLEKFFNELKNIDKIMLLNSTKLKNINSFIFELASNLVVGDENIFDNQPIIVTTFNLLLKDVDVIIISGIDSNNYLFKTNLIDLSKTSNNKEITEFYTYSKNFNLFLYNYFSQIKEVFNYLPIKKLLLSFNKYQSSHPISINNLFLELWKKCTPIIKRKFHYLEKEEKIPTQDIIINKNKTFSLYNNLWKTFSQSSLNILFNDNYSYHIINGIGINKYFEIRFDDGLLGSWIHEIISIYFNSSKKNINLSNLKIFCDLSKTEAYSLKIEDIKEIIQIISINTHTYKKIKKFRILNEDELNYWIKYIAFRTARFFVYLTQIYKKHNITVEYTEFKLGKNKDFETYVFDNKDKKPFEIRGSVDQVISYRNNRLNRKEYYLIDFKTSPRKAFSLKTAFLCEDNQLLLYMSALSKWIKNNEIIRGFLYVPYLISKSTGTLADIERKTKDAFFRLDNIFKSFNNSLNNYVTLNQNPTKRSLNNKKTYYLSYSLLKKLLTWYEQEIVYKFHEIKSNGILSIYPIKENKYNPLNTILPINWISNIDSICLKKEIKNSIKYLISEIDKWSPIVKKYRREYIDSFVDGK